MKKWLFIYSILIFLCSPIINAFAQTEKKPDSKIYWIFLKDKETPLYKTNLGSEYLQISQRALDRRRKVRQEGNLLDKKDWPIESAYRNKLETSGIFIRNESRWLNAVSATIPEDKVETIKRLPFVKKIQPLGKLEVPLPEERDEDPINIFKTTDTFFDYGNSLLQNSQIQVPDVHNLGLSGKGVLVGMLDTGFDHQYPIFSKMDILAEYDFHNRDSITSNQAEDNLYQHNHGTQTLSVIGGYQEGRLIGPAWGASYALAKTEWIPSETRIEEDHWVAGLEWLERLGADVVSSSLGYHTFDDKTGYTYEDLDGNTCVTTIAVDHAAALGVVVVNSAGNERNDPWHFINSPADGDSVIAVGAVNALKTLTSFSSVGPTADGRVKPDVVALGMNTYAMRPSENNTPYFSFFSGTSFSCPLVAGVCALILEAHPELTAMEVRDALRNTADQAVDPDTLYGWGLVDAYEAIFYHGMIFRNFKKISHLSTFEKSLEFNIESRNGIKKETIQFHYRGNNDLSFKILPIQQSHTSKFTIMLPIDINIHKTQFYISATDTLNQEHFGPIHAPDQLYTFSADDGDMVPITLQTNSDFDVYPNYPNPFKNQTTISFNLKEEKITIEIFNIIGQKVAVLANEKSLSGQNQILWNGLDQWGRKVPSGVYLCVLKTKHKTITQKMILIR